MARTLRFTLALTTALCALAIPAVAAEPRISPRVIGGAPAVPGPPFAAALVQRGEEAFDTQFCAGTVIAPRAVITAAHCVAGAPANAIDVVTGRRRLTSTDGQRIPVAAIRVHPNYSPRIARNDVALLLLSRPTSAQPLPVAGASDGGLAGGGAPVVLHGWGGTSNKRGSHSDEIRLGGMRVLSERSCERRWEILYSQSGQLCAIGPDNGKPDACPGDSGGPLVGGQGLAGKLVGIVSFGGRICGDPRAPTVFTRVSAYAGWIAREASGTPLPTPTPDQVPAPPADSSTIRLRFTSIECGVRCRVGVAAGGKGAESVASVNVRIRRGSVDRVFTALPAGNLRWRAQVGLLPLGRVRIVATAIDRDGRAIGRRAKATVTVVPA